MKMYFNIILLFFLHVSGENNLIFYNKYVHEINKFDAKLPERY